MNLQAWKRVKVSDVGNIERAQAGKVYQGGTWIITLSGVNREACKVLIAPQEVDGRYACITVEEDMHPYYLAAVIEREIDRFLHNYATGINLQMETLTKCFKVDFHTNKDTQNALGEAYYKVLKAIDYESKIIELAKERKRDGLNKMFI